MLRLMRMRWLAASLLVVLAACGDSTTPDRQGLQEAESVTGVVERCMGAERNVEPTDEYNGLSKDEALAQANADSDGGGRVVARDEECLGRSRDLRSGRVDFVVQDGNVVWAGVERLPS
jgi:hypothetical protein